MSSVNADHSARLDALLAALASEFPNFRIVPKRGNRLSSLIDGGLRLLTFGGQRSYLTRYHTVIGDTLYVPHCWDDTDCANKIIVLRHERVHLRQRRRYTLVGMALLYLFLPLPIGLAYGRARMEMEAYEETLRATLELRGRTCLLDPALRTAIIERFTGPDYGWMWPFPTQLGRWYDTTVERLLASATTREG